MSCTLFNLMKSTNDGISSIVEKPVAQVSLVNYSCIAAVDRGLGCSEGCEKAQAQD